MLSILPALEFAYQRKILFKFREMIQSNCISSFDKETGNDWFVNNVTIFLFSSINQYKTDS